MERRTCSKCNTSKPVAEFLFRDRQKGSYRSHCIECGRKMIREHYARNIQYYTKKAGARRKAIVNELNEKIYDYLQSLPCVDCGERDRVVLEFDHVRGQKKKTKNFTFFFARFF